MPGIGVTASWRGWMEVSMVGKRSMGLVEPLVKAW